MFKKSKHGYTVLVFQQGNNVNYSRRALVIHPQVTWLGASPDGLVNDPGVTPS